VLPPAPQRSPSHTVNHGRYLLFDWPAARPLSARAFSRRSTWSAGHLHGRVTRQPGHDIFRGEQGFGAAVATSDAVNVATMRRFGEDEGGRLQASNSALDGRNRHVSGGSWDGACL